MTAFITPKTLGDLVQAPESPNLLSVHAGLLMFGHEANLDRPCNLAMYLAQLSHESGGFKYDREVWGPTKTQKRYEGRKDLGNTQPGDGAKFKGRTSIQITGRYNTQKFYEWCKERFAQVPDFVQNPDLMNTDPWEGLGPIWYWDVRMLNVWAAKGDFANLTRKINGGTNGYADRCARYTRIALKMLGYTPEQIWLFQHDHGLKADGIPGPKTRAALHEQLRTLSNFVFHDGQVAVVPEATTPTKPASLLIRILRFFGLGN